MQGLLIWLLRGYKYWISPFLPSACRFHPTCSDYMRESVARHGALRGVLHGLGMSELLDALVISTEVGWRKPHAQIFAQALHALEVEASDDDGD